MYACYRREDAADAVTMLDAVAAVLANYPEHIIQHVTDPRTGLPGRLRFPPNVAEVREACEAAIEPERAAERRRRDIEHTEAMLQSIEEDRQEFARTRAQAPTKAALREKYGEGWGISAGVANDLADRKKRNLEMLAEANRKIFEADCREAGIEPKALGVSPELARQIEARRQFDEAKHREAAE